MYVMGAKNFRRGEFRRVVISPLDISPREKKIYIYVSGLHVAHPTGKFTVRHWPFPSVVQIN